jgi:hypothetical protein
MPGDTMSTAESLRATRTYGQVRCHNPSCTARITPDAGADAVKCERCGSEWRIFWIKPGFPRIRGPVWETSRKLANDQLAKRAGRKEGA